ncbi:P-loop NTPase fold protein, partial [Frankia tisae]|uniref:P-loop NTPase fold protein n=1 Tax=Frankia tisae TaxID=2950104 RepID=UPI0021BFC159
MNTSPLGWSPDGPFAGHPAPAHDGGVLAVAVTPDGQQIITGGDDGTARVWDLADGTPRRRLVGHTAAVHGVAVTPDGAEVVSVGADGTIRVWNLGSGRQVRGTGSARVGAPLPLSGLRSDAPTDEDLLQIDGDVDRLAALAAAVSTAPPVSVALLGNWGSGKSSFMLQMQTRVAQLAELSRNNLGRSAFAASVRQVRFNAWHYSDDQVWTGLIEELLRVLAQPDDPDPADRPDPRIEQADPAARLRQVQETIDAGRQDEQRLTRQLNRLAAARGGTGWLAGLGAPVRILMAPVMALRQLAADLRASWRVVLIWLAVGAAAEFVVWRWGDALKDLMVILVGIASPIGAVVTPLVLAHRRVGSLSGRLEQQLSRRRDQVVGELADLRAERIRLDAAARLADTLSTLAAPDRYERYRGLVGQVHGDLVRFQTDLLDARALWDQQARAGLTTTAPPLERIILYIDDLDRCPPRRVMNVLAAVNLLLALPLFVVVVAVDARWLLRSLAHQRHTMFDTGSDGEAAAAATDSFDGTVLVDQAASSVDYLDKIFQVPFALRPLGERAAPYLD